MNKKDQQALDELRAYLDSRDDKTNKQSDKHILGIAKRSLNDDWQKNHTEAMRETAKTEEWKNAHQARADKLANNPAHIKKMTELNRKTAKTEEWKEAHANGLKKREANGWREKNYEKNMKMIQTLEWKEANKKGRKEYSESGRAYINNRKMIEQRMKNPEYRVKLLAGIAKRDRPFHAGPYGTFPSKSAAARYATEQGLSNALKKFSAWIKTDPTNYYFEEKNNE